MNYNFSCNVLLLLKDKLDVNLARENYLQNLILLQSKCLLYSNPYNQILPTPKLCMVLSFCVTLILIFLLSMALVLL